MMATAGEEAGREEASAAFLLPEMAQRGEKVADAMATFVEPSSPWAMLRHEGSWRSCKGDRGWLGSSQSEKFSRKIRHFL